jgi:exo-beta-1,3-glucanase (GH17 family)
MRAVVAVLFFVTAVHAATWGVFRDKQEAPDFKGILPSVSYAPFEGTAHPDVDNIPNVEKIRADMKKLAPLTRAIRLYSSTGGVELVPPIAAEFGIKVTLGAWIDKNVDRNEREIAAAIDLAKRNSNVIGIVVGNETVFRGEQKVDGSSQRSMAGCLSRPAKSGTYGATIRNSVIPSISLPLTSCRTGKTSPTSRRWTRRFRRIRS